MPARPPPGRRPRPRARARRERRDRRRPGRPRRPRGPGFPRGPGCPRGPGRPGAPSCRARRPGVGPGRGREGLSGGGPARAGRDCAADRPSSETVGSAAVRWGALGGSGMPCALPPGSDTGGRTESHGRRARRRPLTTVCGPCRRPGAQLCRAVLKRARGRPGARGGLRLCRPAHSPCTEIARRPHSGFSAHAKHPGRRREIRPGRLTPGIGAGVSVPALARTARFRDQFVGR